MKKFPELLTPRLRLRQARAGDAEAFGQLLSIPEVTRFSNWPDGPTKAQAQRYVRWMGKVFAGGKGCAWILEERRRGGANLIGAIRFNYFVPKWRYGEIGYELHPDYWGDGLMTEAVCAIVPVGHEIFRLNRIEAWTLPGNGASDRVLEKAGFRYEGTLRQRAWFKGSFHDFRMLARLAGDPLRQ